jgi:hypothetical protein
MDVVWGYAQTDLSNSEILKLAYEAYVKKWTDEGLKHPDDFTMEEQTALGVRGPFIAKETLYNYITARRPFIQECEILDIERPFAVPFSISSTGEQNWYIGRLDKSVKHPQHGKLIIEHKTTSWYATQGNFRKEYLDSFSPNSQVDGYAFSAHIIYEGIKGVWIDISLFHKKIHDAFKFLPIDRQFNMIDDWKDETTFWIERIQSALATLEDNQVDSLSRSFPKNTGSCSNYGGCTYHDVCRFVRDPRTLTSPPDGFKVERWDPFDVLHIQKLGMKPEFNDETTENSNG